MANRKGPFPCEGLPGRAGISICSHITARLASGGGFEINRFHAACNAWNPLAHLVSHTRRKHPFITPCPQVGQEHSNERLFSQVSPFKTLFGINWPILPKLCHLVLRKLVMGVKAGGDCWPRSLEKQLEHKQIWTAQPRKISVRTHTHAQSHSNDHRHTRK